MTIQTSSSKDAPSVTPARTAYVDGRLLPLASASVSVLDRGFLFGDGIYEVCAVIGGRLIDNDAHLARLERSLRAIRLANPHSAAEWTAIEEEVVRANVLEEGLVYLQVTRGAADRDFAFPLDAAPTVVLFTQSKAVVRSRLAETGARTVTTPDLRWARRDVKSVSLLAQVLAKQAAADAGAAEAFMVEDGVVTEGSSSTVFIITAAGEIVTRPLSSAVLPSITRRAVVRLAAEAGLRLVERTFTVEEMLGAAEVFYASATALVTPVIAVDGAPIADGAPGPLTRRLRHLYLELAVGPPST